MRFPDFNSAVAFIAAAAQGLPYVILPMAAEAGDEIATANSKCLQSVRSIEREWAESAFNGDGYESYNAVTYVVVGPRETTLGYILVFSSAGDRVARVYGASVRF